MNGFVHNPLFVFMDEGIPCKFAEIDQIIELSDIGCNARSPQSSFQEIERYEDVGRSEENIIITRKGMESNGNTDDDDDSHRKYNDHYYGKKSRKNEHRFESSKPSVNIFSSNESTPTSIANSNLRETIGNNTGSISSQGLKKFRNRAVGEDRSLSNLSRDLNNVAVPTPSSLTFKLSDELDTSRSANAPRLPREGDSKKFTEKSAIAKSLNLRKECFSKIPVKKCLEQDKSESRPKKVTSQRERNDTQRRSSHDNAKSGSEGLPFKIPKNANVLENTTSLSESKNEPDLDDRRRKNSERSTRSPCSSLKKRDADSHSHISSKPGSLRSNCVSKQKASVISSLRRSNDINETNFSKKSKVAVNAAGIAKRGEVNSNESKRERENRSTSKITTTKANGTRRGSNVSTPARLERRNKPNIFITTCHPGEMPKNKICSTSKSSRRDAKGKTLYPPQGTKSDRTERVNSKLKLTEVNDVKEDPSSKRLENKGYDELTVPVTSQSTVETYSFNSSTKSPGYEKTDADRHDLDRICDSKEPMSKNRLEFKGRAVGTKVDDMAKITRQELKKEFVERCFRDYKSNLRDKSQEIVDIGVTVIEKILDDQSDGQFLPSAKIFRNYIDNYDATKCDKDRKRWFS